MTGLWLGAASTAEPIAQTCSMSGCTERAAGDRMVSCLSYLLMAH
jgi:hypothetical protein